MAVAEKPFTGLTAKVKLGSGSTAEVLGYMSGATLSLEKDIIEILQFSAQYKEKVPAIKDWTLSCEGTFAMADGSSQHKVYQAFESGNPLTISTYLDDNTYFEGTGYISSFEMEMAPDDKITLSCEMAGSGGVTLHLPTVTPPSSG